MSGDDTKVVSLAARTGDNRMVSVEQALEAALADLRAGRFKATRCLLLFDDEPTERLRTSAYTVRRANMTNTEAILAFAILHDKYVRQIRGDE